MTDVLRVLALVEDEDDMRELVRLRVSRDPRIELVGETDNAETAIDLARELQPDLIILDHSLAGELTGIEAAPLIKQAAPHSLILLFTAHDLQRQAKAEPAIDAFLRKDSLGELLPTVERMLALPMFQ